MAYVERIAFSVPDVSNGAIDPANNYLHPFMVSSLAVQEKNRILQPDILLLFRT